MGCYQEEKWGGGRKQIRMSNTSDTFKYGLPAGPGISPGGLRCVFQTEINVSVEVREEQECLSWVEKLGFLWNFGSQSEMCC